MARTVKKYSKRRVAARNKGPSKLAILKLVTAVALDIADFTIGRAMGFGTVFDVALTFVAFLMFGWKGLVQAWEMLDVTDQVDGFVPTLTLLAIAEMRQEKKKR